MYNNACDYLPAYVKNILTIVGYDKETGVIGKTSLDKYGGPRKLSYNKIRPYVGKTMGEIIIIGWDPEYSMLPYVLPPEMIEEYGIDELREVYTETIGSVVAFCTLCKRIFYPRPALIYADRLTSCGCRSGKSPVVKIPEYLYKKDKDSYTRLYRIFRSMIDRCYMAKPGTEAWRNYRDKGIQICHSWYDPDIPVSIVKQFAQPGGFKEWSLAHGYKDPDPGTVIYDALSIDRIDSKGNYCPENCRWIPWREQTENRDMTVWFDTTDLEGNPIKGNMFELAKKYHRNIEIIKNRVTDRTEKRKKGLDNLIWDDYDILTIPSRHTIGHYYHQIMTGEERYRKFKETGIQGLMPKDSVDYRNLYDGPRYNDKGELRDKDGFLILDWKIDIKKRYEIEHKEWVKEQKKKAKELAKSVTDCPDGPDTWKRFR